MEMPRSRALKVIRNATRPTAKVTASTTQLSKALPARKGTSYQKHAHSKNIKCLWSTFVVAEQTGLASYFAFVF
jgi:hypothetical protein